jgi:hypothetical protein
MRRYILRRCLLALPVIFGVAMVRSRVGALARGGGVAALSPRVIYLWGPVRLAVANPPMPPHPGPNGCTL